MATIDDLTNATTDLLTAVNTSKATLDSAVTEATAQVALATAQGALATTQAGLATAIATALTGVDGHATATLAAIQVTNTVIDNVGQANTIADLQLPVAAAGMNFLMMVGEASTAKWRIKTGATDKIYLNGVAGSDNGYVGIATPTVGACLSVFSFKTGASYDWYATVSNGVWAVI